MTAVDEVAKAVDGLLAEGPDEHRDGESVVALFGVLSRLQAVVTEAVGAFAASGEWSLDGARTAASWLSLSCRLPKREVQRCLHRARDLESLPQAREAFASGEISAAHVDLLGRCRRPPTELALRRDEGLLVDKARSLRFDDFSRVVAYWDQHADPDGVEEAAEARRARRDVTMHQSVFGTWLGTMTLDPIAGTIVAEELSRLERRLFEEDCRQTEGVLGRRPTLDELPRTPPQRRADALVEMATRSASCPEDAPRPGPLVSVLVDHPTLRGRICELANGTVVTPGSLLPYLDEALIERVVFTSPKRAEVAATARFFSGATRRAIELRDRRCQHPLCDQPVSRCQADHIVPVIDGGPTTQENGRLLCGFHNRRRLVVDDLPPPGPDG